ncbi:hypothetical protein [Tenuifilum thalassicum]|uniref:Uncharacterized protein n=1 Tax=Tenuifilum thalassicum TaxID=2590900 RepID=A0A7D4B9W3_9BACT|nr:hypothetical protein [Tenuifilum thalassicum]QKG78980.1 hypothetical protein FHG85_01420 [Tenuifilum thalassicum]
MERICTRMTLSLLFILLFSISKGQSDSLNLTLNLFGKSFFDNKEFTGNIKKGYTHPGFFFQPGVRINYERFSIETGFHLLYLAGADTLERLVPYFSASTKLGKNISMIVGTIYSKEGHWLPEPLFKPERLMLNQPETGVQFLYNGEKAKADLWINWERYIKAGSPFQEEFTVGFSHLYNLDSKSHGFGSAIHAMAFHKGGQIDSTDLPVQTIVNISIAPSFTFTSGFGANASFYYYKNLSPSAEFKFNNGFALHPKIFYTKDDIRFELGQWFSNGFINPRGEELFGSISTINPAYDTEERILTTFSVIYQKNIANGLTIKAYANTYYDIKASTLEYSYTLSLTFDGPMKSFR